jgi:anhydro-N-acetylmuramic acid kinase
LEDPKKYYVIGVMSGTSLDGLDIAACEFIFDSKWKFKIIHSETVEYTETWKNNLSSAFYLDSVSIKKLDIDFGLFISESVKKFIDKYHLHIDLISSHGHTVFHKPKEKISLQIGSGRIIAENLGIITINNFRQQDVLLGGQGAPLVPIGDQLLFSEYDLLLNLGGFANISWRDEEGIRKACDIGPCNILFNAICSRINLTMDAEGALAKEGKLIPELFEKWNQIDFFKLNHPKSLGRECFEENYSHDIKSDKYDPKDLLTTASAHVADQILIFISKIKGEKPFKLLCTGGGSYNTNLIKKINSLIPIDSELIIPTHKIINFKEALIFAFIGLLRFQGKVNVLASVTGASVDHSSGDIFIPH